MVLGWGGEVSLDSILSCEVGKFCEVSWFSYENVISLYPSVSWSWEGVKISAASL